MQFDESKHPRDGDGKFSEKANAGRSETDKYIQWAKNNNIDLPLDSNGALDTVRLQKMTTKTPKKKMTTTAPLMVPKKNYTSCSAKSSKG